MGREGGEERKGEVQQTNVKRIDIRIFVNCLVIRWCCDCGCGCSLFVCFVFYLLVDLFLCFEWSVLVFDYYFFALICVVDGLGVRVCVCCVCVCSVYLG
jgi:hypothetical protein